MPKRAKRFLTISLSLLMGLSVLFSGVREVRAETGPEVPDITEDTAEVPEDTAEVPEDTAEAPEDTPDISEDVPDPETLNELSRVYVSLAGDNRYATAVEVARYGWGQGETPKSLEIVIVTGKKFPDALAASAYCGVAKAPILLSDLYLLSPETKALIKEWAWRIKKITVIGKEFQPGFYEDLYALGFSDSKNNMQTIGGEDRYKTAEEVLKATKTLADKEGIFFGTVAVATGQAPYDALSFSPWAYREHIPVLLVKDGMGTETTKALISEFQTVYLLGGSNVCSIDNVSAWQLKIGFVWRLDGANRYLTSEKIAEEFMKDKSYDRSGFSDGTKQHFWDALIAGPLQGGLGGPLILTAESGNGITDVAPWIQANLAGDPSVGTAFFYGWAAKGKGGNVEYANLLHWIESKD